MTKVDVNFAAAICAEPIPVGAGNRPPSMRAIAAFEAAARHQNFAKAADELNLSQSAVSHAIRGLEEQFGVRLFARRGRYLTVTHDGAWLAQRLRATLAQVSDAVGALLAAQGRTTITVEVAPGLAARPLLKAWAGTGLPPDRARLEVRTLAAGEEPGASGADLVISEARRPADAATLRRISLGEILAVGAPQFVGRDTTAWEIVEGPWGGVEAWRNACGVPGLSRPPTLRAATDTLALDAVKAGFGVGLFPRALVSDDLTNGSVRQLNLPVATPEQICWAAWRPTAAGANHIEALVEQLAALA